MVEQENENMRWRFLKQFKAALPSGGDRVAAGRAGKLLLLAGSFFIILLLWEQHPVFSNGMLNLSYHAAAFFGTLLL